MGTVDGFWSEASSWCPPPFHPPPFCHEVHRSVGPPPPSFGPPGRCTHWVQPWLPQRLFSDLPKGLLLHGQVQGLHTIVQESRPAVLLRWAMRRMSLGHLHEN